MGFHFKGCLRGDASASSSVLADAQLRSRDALLRGDPDLIRGPEEDLNPTLSLPVGSGHI